MLQISKEEWDGLINGTDRATPAYIAIDAYMSDEMGDSAEAVALGDLWQDIQEWKSGDWATLERIRKSLFGADSIMPDYGWWEDEGIQAALKLFREEIISRFYEIEVEDSE